MTTSRLLPRAASATLLAAIFAAFPARAADAPVHTIEGFVVDPNGAPIADAEIRYAPDRDRLDSTLPAISDERGAFAIEVLRAGASGRLTIEKQGFATTIVDRVPPLSRRIAVGPIALLRPVGLEGFVRDDRDRPIPGARVTVSLEPDELLIARAPVVSVTAAEDGSFAIPSLPPARLFTQFEAPGHRAVAEWIDLRGAPEVTRFATRLTASEPLRGKIVGEDGSPIEGATIERVGSWIGGVARAAAGADGGFELAATGAPNERFVVRARRHAPLTIEGTQLATGVVTLRTGHSLTASVLESSNSPTPLLSVSFDVFTRHGEGWKHEDGVLRVDDVVVDEKGAWKGALPPGERARVRLVGADGRESSPIDLDLAAPPAGGFVVSAPLPALSRVTGRVVGPTGQPIPNLRVEIGAPNEASLHPRAERAAFTDADGHFVLDGVRAGSWSVMANSDEAISDPKLLAVTATSEPAPIELTAGFAARVAGKLKLDGASPNRALALIGMRYQRIGAGGQHVAALSTHCAEDGAYELSPLPRGAVVVSPLRPPESLDGSWHDFRGWIDALDVKDSPNRANALDAGQLHLDVATSFPVRGVLEGAVTMNGSPRPHARLGLRKKPAKGSLSPEPAAAQIVIADSRGRFRVVVEGGGEFELALFDASLRAERTITFEEGSRAEVVFALEAGSITGKIVAATPSAGPVRVALESPITAEEDRMRRANPSNLDDTPWVSRAEAAVGDDGVYRFADVTTGHYRVALEDVSRTLARVASAPFDLTVDGVEVPPIEAPRGHTLVLTMDKAESVTERFPFASAKVVAADGQPPLDRTFVGWFVGSEAKVEGLPPGRVRVELVVFGKWKPVAPQEITIDPAGPDARLTFTVEPAP